MYNILQNGVKGSQNKELPKYVLKNQLLILFW